MFAGRDGKGRFAPGPGNKGRKPGSVSAEKTAFAAACREALYAGMAPHTLALFNPLGDGNAKVMAVRQRYLEWLADRGLGQVQKDVEDKEGAETLETLLDGIREARNQESKESKDAGSALARQGEGDDDDD